jgi:NADPH-dependent curcumin reductase CurA
VEISRHDSTPSFDGQLEAYSNACLRLESLWITQTSYSLSSALRLLEDFEQLKTGDVIIHNGANGMVGQVIVQLAAGGHMSVFCHVESV